MPSFRVSLAAAALTLFVCAAPAVAQTQCTTNALAGGTANAITVPLLPCGTATNILILSLTATNTSTDVTLQMPGSVALPIKESTGDTLSVGELQAGSVVYLTSLGTQWRLMSNPVGPAGPTGPQGPGGPPGTVTAAGSITLNGATSGSVVVKPEAVTGNYNFNLPVDAGNAGQALVSGGGGSTAMSWQGINASFASITDMENVGAAAGLSVPYAVVNDFQGQGMTFVWTSDTGYSKCGGSLDFGICFPGVLPGNIHRTDGEWIRQGLTGVFQVQWWGCQPYDGSHHDCHDAIQAGMNFIAQWSAGTNGTAQQGGELHFPCGVWETAPFEMMSNVQLAGVTATPANLGLQFSCSRLDFITATTGFGITNSGTIYNVSIHDLSMAGTWTSGITNTLGGMQLTCTYCKFYNLGGSYFGGPFFQEVSGGPIWFYDNLVSGGLAAYSSANVPSSQLGVAMFNVADSFIYNNELGCQEAGLSSSNMYVAAFSFAGFGGNNWIGPNNGEFCDTAGVFDSENRIDGFRSDDSYGHGVEILNSNNQIINLAIRNASNGNAGSYDGVYVSDSNNVFKNIEFFQDSGGMRYCINDVSFAANPYELNSYDASIPSKMNNCATHWNIAGQESVSIGTPTGKPRSVNCSLTVNLDDVNDIGNLITTGSGNACVFNNAFAGYNLNVTLGTGDTFLGATGPANIHAVYDGANWQEF